MDLFLPFLQHGDRFITFMANFFKAGVECVLADAKIKDLKAQISGVKKGPGSDLTLSSIREAALWSRSYHYKYVQLVAEAVLGQFAIFWDQQFAMGLFPPRPGREPMPLLNGANDFSTPFQMVTCSGNDLGPIPWPRYLTPWRNLQELVVSSEDPAVIPWMDDKGSNTFQPRGGHLWVANEVVVPPAGMNDFSMPVQPVLQQPVLQPSAYIPAQYNPGAGFYPPMPVNLSTGVSNYSSVPQYQVPQPPLPVMENVGYQPAHFPSPSTIPGNASIPANKRVRSDDGDGECAESEQPSKKTKVSDCTSQATSVPSKATNEQPVKAGEVTQEPGDISEHMDEVPESLYGDQGSDYLDLIGDLDMTLFGDGSLDP
ncbi:hypothetical protein GGR57DRAFT_516409 [Xylariaceae sp. FL1272]|nr:hypothetical protein GGR57DRAFT_516409 [Xylariaceae sp. FL1272]